MKSARPKAVAPARGDGALSQDLLEQYECGPVRFSGDPNASYERHLVFDHVVKPADAALRERFEALAWSLRDLLSQRWLKTQDTYDRENPKQVYYLSMEFLIGRSLANNVLNLLVEPLVEEEMRKQGLDIAEFAEQEPDAGLGNGGLGRLAACFLDSLATLQIPAIGYGLRYEYGIFRQEIEGGRQVEQPDNWLRRPDPWEVDRPSEAVEVRVACSVEARGETPIIVAGRPSVLRGVPYDRPVVGYGGSTINTLRLWGAAAPELFDFAEFSGGDFFGAVHRKVAAESLTRVLYPDDSTRVGEGLRFAQEHFLVACSLADIIRRFRGRGNDWEALPDKVAIQLNDTHPALAVAELMRILLDGAGLGWDEAWDLTRRTLAYTNHTLYNVTLAQRLIPAADLSEQISTAGYEASGTSNMKFMMNGALTIGTRDGATIEMARAAGEENFFLFGLTAEQVAGSRGWYDPRWHLEHEPETRRALDLIRTGAFDRGEPGVFTPILDALTLHGDHYMHLADLTSYVKAQEQAGALYKQPDAWVRKAVLNVAHSGGFSSDRTITEYALDVWGAEPCPVD